MNDLITIFSSVLPESAKVVGFRGTEALSQPYEIEIFLSLRHEVGEEFDLGDAIGAKARLIIDRSQDKMPPFLFTGIFANLEILHAAEGTVLLRALLVPRLWHLGLSVHSRIFTQMKVPDIIKSVLEENGVLDYELRLGDFEVEEHVCQYRESDLQFISRWMEREGIFYFFQHSEEGEKLILCDQRVYEDDAVGVPVRYFPQTGHDHSAGASFRSFTCRQNTVPMSVRLRDYDYLKPALNVSGSADVASNGAGEISIYGDRFFTPSSGDRLAKIRSEELLSRQVVYQGLGNRFHLRPGFTFELEEHPFPSFNASYLTVTAHHSGNQAVGLAHFRDLTGIEHTDVYQVAIEAIPAKTQFRAKSSAPWPRIYGFENGVVDGPDDSEYAQIDDHGRYKVKFKFDEGSLKDGKATTWVRMMQPHGGDIEGFHFPLRKGTEVVVSFMGGDADRPCIHGVVPNTVTPSPVTSGNHTKNVIQTGGRNRLELEDLAGQQRVTLSTPYANTYLRMGSPNDGHEFIAKTDDNGLVDVGQTLTINSGGFREDHVKSDHFNTTVDGTVTDKFNGTHTTTIKDKVTETYNNGHETTVNAAIRTATYNVGQTTTVNGGPCTEVYNVDHITSVKGKQQISVKSGQTVTVEGDQHLDIKTDKTETISGNYNLTTQGSTVIELKGPEQKITHGPFNRLYKSENVNVVLGVKSDTFIGGSNTNTIAAANSNFFGIKLDLTAAGVFEANLSYKFSITAGFTLAIKFGAAITFNNAVEVKLQNVKIKTGAAAIECLGPKLGTFALRWHLSPTHVLA